MRMRGILVAIPFEISCGVHIAPWLQPTGDLRFMRPTRAAAGRRRTRRPAENRALMPLRKTDCRPSTVYGQLR
jgi:hypothetical protein